MHPFCDKLLRKNTGDGGGSKFRYVTPKAPFLMNASTKYSVKQNLRPYRVRGAEDWTLWKAMTAGLLRADSTT